MNNRKIANCVHHGETEFRQENKGKWRCVKCSSEAVQKRRDKIKILAVKYKGGKCQVCGYNKCVEVFDFHHLDPNEKDFGISSKGYTRSWDKVKEELDKCILVCSNCHREIHCNDRVKLFTEKDLDECEKLVLPVKEYEIKINESKFTCKDCGNFLKNNTLTGLCNKCYTKQKSKEHFEDRGINQNTLKELIRSKSFMEIGRQFNVSDRSVAKWCLKFNLPTTKKEIKSISEIEWEKL